jgi:hypothetical protein
MYCRDLHRGTTNGYAVASSHGKAILNLLRALRELTQVAAHVRFTGVEESGGMALFLTICESRLESTGYLPLGTCHVVRSMV